MENRQLTADISSLCADIRAFNATLHILHEYAANTELTQTGRVDNIIMALGDMIDLFDKIELTADAVETDAYSKDGDQE